MKFSLLLNLESLSSILFNIKKNKNKTRNLNFLTKNFEIWHEHLKTRNDCFLN